MRCPDFPRAADAVGLILQRASDQEDSMRKLATSICSELWFVPGTIIGEATHVDGPDHFMYGQVVPISILQSCCLGDSPRAI